ncbi:MULTISPECIES: hypothetical protein [Pseudoalteromonas]|uniref:Uncharacterized protein n=1 Tax=Pseudoalteromonas amylolytica TaxID=1859457 RepID=A0A1S1MPS7_9GAMM|nr:MULTISPECIES: hypothetical protein [Pseudoalteromonas]MCF6437036.1 hypothetical protein [Pseudoalteromonas sp. MMG022]OHU85767.1 hypothetical protein BFC16_17810 [Pseudoalteromonas sp. JW3]OHU87331.1 hypothetical protein BET10_20575 [Pseudoalteromonas amylolytica]
MRFSKWFIISCLCVLFLSVINAPLSYAKIENHYEQQQSIYIDADPIDHDPQEPIVGTLDYEFHVVGAGLIACKGSDFYTYTAQHFSIRAPPVL